jgi:hypothetical protein
MSTDVVPATTLVTRSLPSSFFSVLGGGGMERRGGWVGFAVRGVSRREWERRDGGLVGGIGNLARADRRFGPANLSPWSKGGLPSAAPRARARAGLPAPHRSRGSQVVGRDHVVPEAIRQLLLAARGAADGGGARQAARASARQAAPGGRRSSGGARGAWIARGRAACGSDRPWPLRRTPRLDAFRRRRVAPRSGAPHLMPRSRHWVRMSFIRTWRSILSTSSGVMAVTGGASARAGAVFPSAFAVCAGPERPRGAVGR